MKYITSCREDLRAERAAPAWRKSLSLSLSEVEFVATRCLVFEIRPSAPYTFFRPKHTGQSHLNVKEVIESDLKTGDDEMEEGDLRALETVFAQVQDPRMERTRVASLAGYHHSGDLWSDLRSRGRGRN